MVSKRPAPDDWVQVLDEPPWILVKWGTIFVSLIGGPLAALGIGLTNLPLGLFRAISGGLNAIGTAIESFIAALLGSAAWLIGEQAREAATVVEESGIGALLVAILIGGVTLYTAVTAYDVLTGGGG